MKPAAADPRRLMGFVTPGDERVTITAREWDAVKRALWRNQKGWEIAAREATELLARCRHLDGCPGAHDEKAPCSPPVYTPAPSKKIDVVRRFFARVAARLFRRKKSKKSKPSYLLSTPATLSHVGCPDREVRMSALVVLNASRQFAPTNAHQPPDAPYFAPSREYFSEVVATLLATQIEIEELRSRAGDTHSAPQLESKETTP